MDLSSLQSLMLHLCLVTDVFNTPTHPQATRILTRDPSLQRVLANYKHQLSIRGYVLQSIGFKYISLTFLDIYESKSPRCHRRDAGTGAVSCAIDVSFSLALNR